MTQIKKEESEPSDKNIIEVSKKKPTTKGKDDKKDNKKTRKKKKKNTGKNLLMKEYLKKIKILKN